MINMLHTMRFISILLVALALSASMAHVFALPNKIGLPRDDYFIAQQLYRGWSLLGIVVIGALLSTLILTVLVRDHGKVFTLTLVSLLCIAATQVIFWIFTFPANQRTNNWTSMPADWEQLRRQWEYSHAAGAIFNLAAFCLLVLSFLVKEKHS